ncbi:hypothetical protein MXL26_10200 [Acinetobacter towneri]|uniref:hypothetical protein n=1 Tax=Acinetobacter towneri TaxID=202956 RepID=UPI002DB918A5|nr:hypothetical protein [Acinetobacter towneri]MEB6565709.1 hypothetical protein [Acinetobacter towneri]
MDNQLEQARDAWLNAFFTGNVETLAQYEDDDFSVIYEAESRVENRETRYATIQHAVKNGVWKPQKTNVDSEEYAFDREQVNCRIQIGLADDQGYIQEIWCYLQGWKIQELRFCAAKVSA